MSEEFKIFRGDQDPQEGQGTSSAPAAKKPAPVAPSVPAPQAAAELHQAAEPHPAAPEAKAAAAPQKPKVDSPPPPPLDFHLDESQLFHTTEAVQQRMAQLASIAHSTAHQLDEQAAETERIGKRLKSL